MSDSTLVFAGVMLRGDRAGNISPGSGSAPGLFISDVRVLSRLELAINGSACTVASEALLPGRRTVVLVPRTARQQSSDIVVTRSQVIDATGLSESIAIENVTTRPVNTSLVLDLESDFADPFQLRSDRRTYDRSSGSIWIRQPDGPRAGRLAMGYERELRGRRFQIELDIAASGDPVVEISSSLTTSVAATLRWDIHLDPGQTERLSITATSGEPRDLAPLAPAPAAVLASNLGELRRQALADIQSLRMPCPRGLESDRNLADLTIVGAGAPWFLTLFGRDSMLTSLLAESDLPGLADDNLRALIATQATTSDPERVADPGKILHELRRSELAQLREVPYGDYYGSVDSTPLFLSALAALGSVDLQRSSEQAARAAIDWMCGAGGLGETGFLRYVSDPNGLITQGWKDSADSVAHSDGRVARGAIALCEVQGYAWRALVDTARLARDVWDDPEWAANLEEMASDLRQGFRERFWMPGSDFPALALDGADDMVGVVASNAGHLLFSGMLTATEAARVATRLLDADMFTGWGIRTLSSSEIRYNPLAYHNGSVWPHDTMLAAVGMASYGMRNEAKILATAIVEAAAHFGNRPPELFGGFDRTDYELPVRYAGAAVPQAWASAAMLAAVRILEDLVPPHPVFQ